MTIAAVLATLFLALQTMFGTLPIDGIRCDSSEGAVEHVHANLQLFERGRDVRVPADIGIPLTGNCLYWVHTHSTDGMIHIEAPLRRAFTLGQFFDVWGETLDSRQAGAVKALPGRTLRVSVNGRIWRRDPRLVVLRDRETIVIQSGPPYAHPQRPDWSRV